MHSLCQIIPEKWNLYEQVVYNKDAVVYGVKLDFEGGPKSIVTANRFVTHVISINGAETNAAGAKVIRKAKPDSDKLRLVHFNTSIRTKQPVLAIMANRCLDGDVHFPKGMRLCPMEQFRTTKTWPEKVNGGVFYQVAHEVLNCDNIWWVSSQSRDAQLAAMGASAQIEKLLCSTCGQYTRENMCEGMAICINEACNDKGTDNRVAPEDRKLTFH